MNQLLLSWGPMILLIVVWVIFMIGFGQRGQRTEKLIKEHAALLERLVKAAERIADNTDHIKP